jgi:hypothetical protein
MTLYRDAMFTWRDESTPLATASPAPPPLPFTITRSEIMIRDSEVPLVHVWYAAIPPESAATCYQSAIGARVHGPGCACREPG